MCGICGVILNPSTDNKLVDQKEFADLYSVRAIMVNDKPLNDPHMDINKVKKIKIGIREIQMS